MFYDAATGVGDAYLKNNKRTIQLLIIISINLQSGAFFVTRGKENNNNRLISENIGSFPASIIWGRVHDRTLNFDKPTMPQNMETFTECY